MRTRTERKAARIATALVALLLCSASAWADENGYKGEVTGFGGVQHFPGATKAMGGGAFGRALGKSSQLFGEASYVPLGDGYKLFNFGGGLNIGIPTSAEKLTPYVSVIGGLGRWSGFGESEQHAAFGGGFGARYFLGTNWGVRPEFRWLRYQASEGGMNSYQLTAGLFYRFGN